MPITFAQIATNTASVTLYVLIEDEEGKQSEESVTVKYYPGRVTETTIAVLQSVTASDETNLQENFHAFNETLCSLIKSWDVFEDPKKTVMFPIDPLRFAELAVGFRAQVVDAILKDIRPEALAPKTRASQNGNS